MPEKELAVKTVGPNPLPLKPLKFDPLTGGAAAFRNLDMELTMGAKMEIAKHRLFDVDAIHASDVKLFPGSSRDITSEQMADQISKVIAQLENGDYELVDEECD